MLSKTKEFILIGCVAIAVGFLFILPPLAIKYHIESGQNNFALVELKTHRDEIYTYIPRAREVYDGHFPPSDLSFNNKQKIWSLDNSLPPAIFALFMDLFKGDTTWAYLGVQFVFSAVIFILLYVLGRLVFKSKRWSVFFALTGVLTPFISNVFAFDFRGSFKVFFDFSFKQFIPLVRSQIDKLRLARVDNPLLVYPFYLSAIICFIRFWKQPNYRWSIAAGISGALLAYVYHRTWVYWSIFLVVMFFLTIIFFKQYQQLRRGYYALGIFFSISIIPYLINSFNFSSSQFYQEVYRRSHIFTGRDLSIFKDNWLEYVFYAVVVFIIFLFYIRKEQARRFRGFLLLGFIVSAVIARNLQFLTGLAEAPIAWRYPIAPVIFILTGILFFDLWEYSKNNWPRLRKPLAYLPIILALLVFTKYTVNAISLWQHPNSETLLYYKFPNEVIDSWDWINSNLESEPKIISPSYVTSIYLTTYTSARPFLLRGNLSLASNMELEDRLIVARKLFGITPDLFKKQLEGTVSLDCVDFDCFPDTGINLNKTWLQLYGEGYEDIISNNGSQSMDGKIGELLERFKKKTNAFTKVDVDYVYQGPWEKQLGTSADFPKDKDLSLVYENSLVKMYKILGK